MADYRDHYDEIVAAGANLAAVSVDTSAQSEALRAQLSLPFPLLCDVERRVVRTWDLLNAEQRGGIAKPAVFIIDPGLTVRHAAVGTVVSRVPAAEILAVFEGKREAAQTQRKNYWPVLTDWIRAIRNNFRTD